MAIFLAVPLAAVAGDATGPRVGEEFVVPTTLAGTQNYPTATTIAEGFVVVWQDTSSGSLRARLFDEAGTPNGDDFPIAEPSGSRRCRPSAASLPTGGFVVAYEGGEGGCDFTDAGSAVYASRFSAEGLPLGEEQVASQRIGDRQAVAHVATDSAGGFVVVWSATLSVGDDDSGYSIQGRRFAPDGTPSGEQFQVNEVTELDQRNPRVAVDGSDNFIVTWGTQIVNSTDHHVVARRYAHDGSALSSEFFLSQTPSSFPHALVTFDDEGGFTAAWRHGGLTARTYDADGDPVGDEFLVTENASIWSLATLEDGSHVVVWSGYWSPGDDDDDRAAVAHRLRPDWSPLGHPFQVNTRTAGHQNVGVVLATGDKEFHVFWKGFGKDWIDILGQKFSIDLFSDGFESGDTSAWSTTVP